uniref:Uncharacterized protein n=1 Tax=Oryza brachyantha TaxID=4533 RepID=J3MZT3_ORYBR
MILQHAMLSVTKLHQILMGTSACCMHVLAFEFCTRCFALDAIVTCLEDERHEEPMLIVSDARRREGQFCQLSCM